jgi:hypothetical protein
MLSKSGQKPSNSGHIKGENRKRVKKECRMAVHCIEATGLLAGYYKLITGAGENLRFS